MIEPPPPVAGFALPWDDPVAPDPVAALADARARLGDTFVVHSGTDRYLFVFSPDALPAFYALPERVASKGLADVRMLSRKLPPELFAGRRTLASDLFGAQDVETYLGHLDTAIDRQLTELGDEGTVDVFALARRLGHRLALGCWMGDRAASPPLLDPLIADFERLDGAEAFVSPERMGSRSPGFEDERAALGRLEDALRALLVESRPDGGFLSEIAGRWDGSSPSERVRGITGDVVLLHVATMTNLFAALGWSLALLVLNPAVRVRVERGDDGLLERSVLEAIRLGQRSIMLRAVRHACDLDDGAVTYRVEPGVLLATMLPLTNSSAAPGLDRYDPDRWSGARLRAEDGPATAELVTTFGHGSHRCPARRFSLSVIGRGVRRLLDTYELTPGFGDLRPPPSQIGGVARAADPCPVAYRRRPSPV